MSKLQQLSYPVDHNDPAIQHDAVVGKEVACILRNFRDKPINASNLRALGDALTPSPKIEQAAKAVAESIQDVVRKCSSIGVDRSCIGGSFGKKTALPDFDVDLILFLNEASPPFESELKLLREELLRKLPGMTILNSSPLSITFLLNGFKVDLLPAPNLVSGPSQSPRIAQYKAILAELARAPPTKDRDAVKRARYFSAAFSETHAHFMKKQPPFVNAAVRLAKMWKRACAVTSVTFPRWFTSFLIELVVSDTAIAEMRTNPHDASLVRVIKTFFQRLSTPGTLRIVFSDYYPESAIPKWIASQTPLVMDPANPYSNVAKHMNWDIIRLLALDVLSTLDQAAKAPKGVAIGELFRPRLGEDVSRLYRQCNFQLRFVKHSSWLRSLQVRKIVDLDGKMMDQGVTWRAKDKLDRNDVATIAKPYILNAFDTLVQVTNLAMIFQVARAVHEDGVCEVVAAAKFIDGMLLEVFDTSKVEWTSTSRTHESCDVTCIFGQIPIPSQADDLRYLYFQLSFDVDDKALDYMSNSIAASLCHEQQDLEED